MIPTLPLPDLNSVYRYDVRLRRIIREKKELKGSREISRKITTSNHVNLVYLLSSPFVSFRSFRTLSALYSLLLRFSAFFCLLVGPTFYMGTHGSKVGPNPWGRGSMGTHKNPRTHCAAYSPHSFFNMQRANSQRAQQQLFICGPHR